MTDWIPRFLALAEHVAQWSKDPSTKVGAVIVDQQNRVVAMGYNGFPRGIDDDNRLQDRDAKNQIIVHAEINAILTARADLTGCTIYCWPMPPCPQCAAAIIQAGIKIVMSVEPADRWRDRCQVARDLLTEAGRLTIWFGPEDWMKA